MFLMRLPQVKKRAILVTETTAWEGPVKERELDWTCRGTMLQVMRHVSVFMVEKRTAFSKSF
jgi:hypothetical protein